MRIRAFVLFNNEAVRGCSIRLEEVRLGEALGVDPEGKKVVVEVEGTKQAVAVADTLQQGVEAVGCTARPAEASS